MRAYRRNEGIIFLVWYAKFSAGFLHNFVDFWVVNVADFWEKVMFYLEVQAS